MDIEKTVLDMVEIDRKKSMEDRKDAEKAYKFFFKNLESEGDRSNASKEALARLLEAKISANNSAIEASKILVVLIKEDNKRAEINSKTGNYGEKIEDIDLADLSEDLDDEEIV